MPHSSTTLQTDIFRRHFTRSWKIFTRYATITDGINPSVYFQWELFFLCAHFSSVKPLTIFFFTDIVSDEMWYYQWKGCRRMLFVGELVGKTFTDRVWISHRRKVSVGKIVKSCSDSWCSCACLEGCQVAVLCYIENKSWNGGDKGDDRCKVVVMARRKGKKRWQLE
jgi:hypothetical protein